MALFGRRSLGQYPAPPSSPGPFVLLLSHDRCCQPGHLILGLALQTADRRPQRFQFADLVFPEFHCTSLATDEDNVGGPPTVYHTHQKASNVRVIFSGGGVRIVGSSQETSKMYTTPKFGMAMFDMVFVGVVHGLLGSTMLNNNNLTKKS